MDSGRCRGQRRNCSSEYAANFGRSLSYLRRLLPFANASAPLLARPVRRTLAILPNGPLSATHTGPRCRQGIADKSSKSLCRLRENPVKTGESWRNCLARNQGSRTRGRVAATLICRTNQCWARWISRRGYRGFAQTVVVFVRTGIYLRINLRNSLPVYLRDNRPPVAQGRISAA